MNAIEVFLEKTWDGILSCETKKIQQTFSSLDEQNQLVVLEHLRKMTGELGWQPEQVKSASAALQVIAAMRGK